MQDPEPGSWRGPPLSPQLPRSGLRGPSLQAQGTRVVHDRSEVTAASRGQQFPEGPSLCMGMRVLLGPAGNEGFWLIVKWPSTPWARPG